MAAVEKGYGGDAEAEDEETKLLQGVTVVDFDVLCSTVAAQATKGGWGKLNGENEEDEDQYGTGLFRMWEGGDVHDCFDDRRLAIESICCPCYRFGKNMKRAGFGSCFLQGSIYLILVIIAIFSLLTFIITGKHCLLYLVIGSTVLAGIYVGYYRTQMRKKFKIQGSESSFDDCLYHLVCPCCTLCQESRTLEMNNVQDGIWYGRGDTICIGTLSEDSKPLFSHSNPSFLKCPDSLIMQKTSNDSSCKSTSEIVCSSPLVVPQPE